MGSASSKPKCSHAESPPRDIPENGALRILQKIAPYDKDSSGGGEKAAYKQLLKRLWAGFGDDSVCFSSVRGGCGGGGGLWKVPGGKPQSSCSTRHRVVSVRLNDQQVSPQPLLPVPSRKTFVWIRPIGFSSYGKLLLSLYKKQTNILI